MPSNDDKRHARLWYATAEIDDYFRRLGGSGCYPGYCDWHAPALMTLALDHRHVSHQNQGDKRLFEYSDKDLISYWMWEQTDGLPKRAVELAIKLKPTPEDTEWFLDRATERYPMAYFSYEKEDGQTLWSNAADVKRSIYEPAFLLTDCADVFEVVYN